jgi:hypothetical protein
MQSDSGWGCRCTCGGSTGMAVTNADCVGKPAGRTGTAGNAGLAGTCLKCAPGGGQFSQRTAIGTSNQTHTTGLRCFARRRGEIECSAVINDFRYSSDDFPLRSRSGITVTYPGPACTGRFEVVQFALLPEAPASRRTCAMSRCSRLCGLTFTYPLLRPSIDRVGASPLPLRVSSPANGNQQSNSRCLPQRRKG